MKKRVEMYAMLFKMYENVFKLVHIVSNIACQTIVVSFCFHLAFNVYDPQGIESMKYNLTNINILIFTAKKCQINNVLNE